jgi:hypothetical protein
MIRRLSSFALGGSLTGVVGLGIVVAIHGSGPLHLALIVLGGVVALAALFWLGEDGVDPLMVRLGAIGVGVLALGAELVGGERGIGVTQTVLLVVAGAVVLVGPWMVSRLWRPLPPWAIGVGFVAVAAVLVMTVIDGGALGHDESAYASRPGRGCLGPTMTAGRSTEPSFLHWSPPSSCPYRSRLWLSGWFRSSSRS